MTIAEFAVALEKLYQTFPFSSTSWWRTKTRNAKVGGKENSKHLTGLATDVVLDPGVDKTKFYIAVRAQELHFLDEGDHIHIQDSGV